MTAALLKKKDEGKKHKTIDVESLLKAKFEELLTEEQLDRLPKEEYEAVMRCMRQANKIGYTNGYKKASMESKKA